MSQDLDELLEMVDSLHEKYETRLKEIKREENERALSKSFEQLKKKNLSSEYERLFAQLQSHSRSQQSIGNNESFSDIKLNNEEPFITAAPEVQKSESPFIQDVISANDENTKGEPQDSPAEKKDDIIPANEQSEKALETVAVPTQIHPVPARTKRKMFRTGDLIFYLLLAVLVVTVYFLMNSQGVKPRSIGGYSAFTVLTGSMRPEIPEGSLVIVKKTDAADIVVGDDVTYLYNDKATVTHRVVEIYENYNGSGVRGFVTKGTNNKKADDKVVQSDSILGVVKVHVPHVGAVGKFIKDKPYLIIIPVVILIVLVYVLRYLRRTRKSKPPPAFNPKVI